MLGKHLDPEEFDRLLGRQPVLDLRRAKAFRALALPGALHLPWKSNRTAATLQAELQERWPGQACLLYDQAGENRELLDQVPGCRYLDGGFEAYEQWQAGIFAGGPRLLVLGGLTGAGKTEVLQQLAARGEQVIDLEGLARHRGSAFGNLWHEEQAENGVFQHLVFQAWRGFDAKKVAWVEEEGAFLGRNSLPAPFFARMQAATMIALDVPFEERLNRIVAGYGHAPADEVTAAISRLEKRLGIHLSQKARHLFEAGKVRASFSILLQYYDGTYLHRRESQHQGPVISFPQFAQHEELLGRLCGYGRENSAP